MNEARPLVADDKSRQEALLSRISEPVWALGAAAFVAAITAYRLRALRFAVYPGHADAAFYYNVAQNLDAGRGPKIDYVWEFLTGQPDLPRYAFDYWLPLPSVLMWIAIHLHQGLVSALIVNVLMSVLLAAGTYWLARELTRSRWVPAAAAAIVLVQPVITIYSVFAEGAIYFGAFAVLAMAAAVGARSRPWLWPVAGVFAAFANLSRNEGILLIVVLVVAAVASPSGGNRVWRTLATLGGYVVAMMPLYVMSLQNSGALMPTASAKVPFIYVYENLFALHVDRSLQALIGGSIGNFFSFRVDTLMVEIGDAFAAMLPLDAVLILALMGSALARFGTSGTTEVVGPRQLVLRWWSPATSSPWFVPVGFVVLVFAFYTLVVPVVGGAVNKNMTAILPVLVVGAMVQLANLGFRPATTLSIAAVLALAPVLALPSVTQAVIAMNNNNGEVAAQLTPLLLKEQGCIGTPVILMTRNPWEVTQATGFRTVMIPNGPLADILEVARRYGVTDIQLTPNRAASLNPAVSEAYAGSGPLALSPSFPDQSVLRIRAATLNGTC